MSQESKLTLEEWMRRNAQRRATAPLERRVAAAETRGSRWLKVPTAEARAVLNAARS